MPRREKVAFNASMMAVEVVLVSLTTSGTRKSNQRPINDKCLSIRKGQLQLFPKDKQVRMNSRINGSLRGVAILQQSGQFCTRASMSFDAPGHQTEVNSLSWHRWIP